MNDFADLPDDIIKVMYLNPISATKYNEGFLELVKTYKYPETAVYVASLNPENVPKEMDNLEYRTYEALIVRDTVQAAYQCRLANIDAMVIGCFYDPALQEAREICGNSVVVAPCQASLQIAANLGNRFSIIIGMEKWKDQMEATVYEYGYRDNLASFQVVGIPAAEFPTNPDTKKELQEAAARAVLADKAEVIILGCTLEAGFYQTLQDYLKEHVTDGRMVPVIDPSIASLKTAEKAAWLKRHGWVTSQEYGMQQPPADEMKKFGIFQEDYRFGQVLVAPPK